jgi:Excalibur calcium-binding domain
MQTDHVAQHALRPGAEERLRRLQRRFRALGQRWGMRYWLTPAILGVGLGLAALAFYDLAEKFGSPGMALRHLASMPNCSAAGAVALAPARDGEPGYWRTLDRDGDGIACEALIGR